MTSSNIQKKKKNSYYYLPIIQPLPAPQYQQPLVHGFIQKVSGPHLNFFFFFLNAF